MQPSYSQPSYYSLSDSKVLEGDVAEVIISRSGDLDSPQTLRLQSFGGTARLGVDYDKVDEVIQFSANQDSYTSLIQRVIADLSPLNLYHYVFPLLFLLAI